VYDFGDKVAKNAKFEASGPLSFLNEWKFELGAEILVPRGRQELFESGILHYYQYGQLYNPNSKIIVRTTTQDRMLKVGNYSIGTSEYLANLILELRIFHGRILWLRVDQQRYD
jgi:hypothetical protein